MSEAKEQNIALTKQLLEKNEAIKDLKRQVDDHRKQVVSLTEQQSASETNLSKYTSKVKDSCEKQLQDMLDQYNEKLGVYETNLKDQSLKLADASQKADKQQLAYKELKSRMNEQLREARGEARS